MHAISLLQTWLERNGVIGHQARVGALMRVVESLLSGGKLSLTQLGRYRAGTAYVKHHIKAVDRLLGNHHLHAEREGLYRALSTRVLASVARPVMVSERCFLRLKISRISIQFSASSTACFKLFLFRTPDIDGGRLLFATSLIPISSLKYPREIQ